MYGQIATVAFVGIEARPVEVQVRISGGGHVLAVVGLPDKAVAESRERVRNALHAIGLGLPWKHITVNLAPADLPKEGSHFDLPIALAMMVAMGAISPDAIEGFAAIGELALDGSIRSVPGALPAAIGANAMGKGLICPGACGPEAAWADEDMTILAPPHLLSLVNHFKGLQSLPRPKPNAEPDGAPLPDLKDVKGQESAKRVLEVAAAGGHNLLMIGAPGSGKSMLAARLPSILPPLSPEEMLEVSMVHSLAGELLGGRIATKRPFRAPHHSASMAALVGGGSKPRPGEVSLAHLGVLFLDELPEFLPNVLDALRQPLEAGETVIARANHRIAYPSRIQLVAAMNPCKCGGSSPGQSCKRGPRCADDYQARISGPCSTASICRSRCRRCRRPISCCRRRPRAAPRCARASAPRARCSARALPRSAPRACAPTRNARAACSSRWRCRTRRASRCCARRRRRCSSRPAASTARCAWRGRWPISTAPRASPACTSPRR